MMAIAMAYERITATGDINPVTAIVLGYYVC